jgi:hypothetical protein
MIVGKDPVFLGPAGRALRVDQGQSGDVQVDQILKGAEAGDPRW